MTTEELLRLLHDPSIPLSEVARRGGLSLSGLGRLCRRTWNATPASLRHGRPFGRGRPKRDTTGDRLQINIAIPPEHAAEVRAAIRQIQAEHRCSRPNAVILALVFFSRQKKPGEVGSPP